MIIFHMYELHTRSEAENISKRRRKKCHKYFSAQRNEMNRLWRAFGLCYRFSSIISYKMNHNHYHRLHITIVTNKSHIPNDYFLTRRTNISYKNRIQIKCLFNIVQKKTVFFSCVEMREYTHEETLSADDSVRGRDSLGDEGKR